MCCAILAIPALRCAAIGLGEKGAAAWVDLLLQRNLDTAEADVLTALQARGGLIRGARLGLG